MPPRNMFLACVTVGLVLLASKYRNNVLRSVKKWCHRMKDRNNNRNSEGKKELKVALEKVIIADSPEKCDYAVQRIRCDSSGGVLGFDCEWINDGPVALLQLATFNGICGLFRISKIGYIPKTLKELLANRRILKVGVASFEDGQKIMRDYGTRVEGTLDLRTLAHHFALPCPKSLAALSLEYLGVEMDKIIEVRCGDWDADCLADEQVTYAACDAIAAVLIYHRIIQKAKASYSLWESFVIYIKNLWNEVRGTNFHGLPKGIIDTRFKVPYTDAVNHNTGTKNNQNNKMKETLSLHSNNIVHKSRLPARNKPLYHNCYLQAPDGEILCTCDRKKAEWYLTKGLGEMIKEEPYTVRLKFEPSGRALGEVGQYYTQVKANQCVVCGFSEKFVRKNVVPREYRKYFPVVMKAHQSHDVLLLCPPCHEISNSHDLQLRRKLAEMCDAPLVGPLTHAHKYRQNCHKLQSAVKALRSRSILPSWRRDELESYIQVYGPFTIIKNAWSFVKRRIE